jgi:hypothetical protein
MNRSEPEEIVINGNIKDFGFLQLRDEFSTEHLRIFLLGPEISHRFEEPSESIRKLFTIRDLRPPQIPEGAHESPDQLQLIITHSI